MEDDFSLTVNTTIADLEYVLIDIAYYQKPECLEITEKIRNNLAIEIEKRKSENADYYKSVCERVDQKIKMIKEGTIEKEARWRRLKHQQVLEAFQKEVDYQINTSFCKKI